MNYYITNQPKKKLIKLISVQLNPMKHCTEYSI